MNCHGVAEASFHPLAVINQALLMLEAFPISLRAIHIVRPGDFTLREVLPIIKLDIGKKLRQRLVVHQGKDDEDVLESLDEYGLPRPLMKEALEEPQPNRKDWIHHRLAQEYTEFFTGEVSLQRGGRKFVGLTFAKASDIGTHPGAANDKNVASQIVKRKRSSSPSYHSRDLALALEIIEDTRSRFGRNGDERMNRAVETKVQNPTMTSYDALVAGGFVFPPMRKGVKASDIYDNDNVSLQQRTNQLSRRLRRIRDTVAVKGRASELDSNESS